MLAPRVPLRLACTLFASSLVVGLGLLGTGAAPASPSRQIGATARRTPVHGGCAARPGRSTRRATPHGKANHSCTTGSRSPAGHAHAGGGAIEATPLNVPSGPAPAPAGGVAQPPRSEGSSAPSAGGGAPPAGGAGTSPPAEALPEGGVTTDPIDPRYLTEVPFGKTSFWVQPWRAYLDTWPSSQLLSAVGINFDMRGAYANAAAQVLQDSGFKLARVSIGWNALSYSDPTTLRPENAPGIRAVLTAAHNHGLRPLILLNANSGDPTPSKLVSLTTLANAPAGAQTVRLDPASAATVVPGKTGFNNLSWVGSPDILITSVDANGVATLSRALPQELPAGKHGGTTLLYAPFASPTLPGGQPNPAFQATLAGWLTYVATVCREAESIVGPGGYDLEVWNEITFGSQFLNAEEYGPPVGRSGPAAKHKAEVTRAVTRALLKATVAYVRDPAHGLSPAVGITNGFASETPFPSGAAAPLGLTALSKHPYVGLKSFPAGYRIGFDRPVNALGVQDLPPKSKPPFTPLFIPTYSALLPEYMLTANATETLIRDVAPFTTNIYGFPHGREVGPPGGSPVQKWITEYNLGVPQGFGTVLTAADQAHFHAKALLRSLVSNVSKGITREYFFGASPAPSA